ncbi:hypothetical protein ATANTOWER_032281, partial [Ataeniobius toweri]|nr:hypothetical protein [Ataeniobius toweri]
MQQPIKSAETTVRADLPSVHDVNRSSIRGRVGVAVSGLRGGAQTGINFYFLLHKHTSTALCVSHALLSGLKFRKVRCSSDPLPTVRFQPKIGPGRSPSDLQLMASFILLFLLAVVGGAVSQSNDST